MVNVKEAFKGILAFIASLFIFATGLIIFVPQLIWHWARGTLDEFEEYYKEGDDL